jgi:L-arabonate dehydrase
MAEGNEKKALRSREWFGRLDSYGFIYRSWLRNQGHTSAMFDGRPVIGICNSWSDLNPCNGHLRDLAEHVRRGVIEGGGFPLEFPVTSLGEALMRPTAMLFRNLVSMDVEASIRANPIDGVVLLVGCDKTTPAAIMGAASVGLPTIVVSGGPMLSGWWKGRRIGSGTDVIRFKDAVRAGTMSLEEFMEAESAMSSSVGSCMAMGTASTMASLCEGLGLALPQNGATPAADARRKGLGFEAGKRIVGMIAEDLSIARILTREALQNAVVLNAALGGSTNAVVHLQAIAGRLGVPFSLDDWDRWGSQIPCLVNLMPSGEYLMEDFFRAGGVPALMNEIADFLNGDALTVTGRTHRENNAGATCHDERVIRPLDKPVRAKAGIAVLRGNIAPNGAVIKPSAATPSLLVHRGRAIVFRSADDLKQRVDDPDLPVDKNSVLVLQNCGPKGYPGMAEIGNMPIPAKLLREGVTDMVRISDARMSGTAFGTIVLHIAPEAAVGGPLALVRDGDVIELNVPDRVLRLDVSEEELDRRRVTVQPFVSPYTRGYERLFVDHVMQADAGVDFDFLVGNSGAHVPRVSH